jgi:hypothetical protein
VKGAALADGRPELKRAAQPEAVVAGSGSSNRNKRWTKGPKNAIGIGRESECPAWSLSFDACLESLGTGAEADKADMMPV